MKEIKSVEEQPLDCPKCKEKKGYQFSDFILTHYSLGYLPDGECERSWYSDDQKILNAGKTAYCFNCGSRLPFKINRAEE